jgi:RNA polymerase sigma-70 factor, ECF subfamily
LLPISQSPAGMHTTPISLLERLRDTRETTAWDQFVELYTPLLLYWARKAGLQESDAADLVQDVLLVLIRKLPEFHYERGGSFRSWLRTITLNKWRDRHKRARLPLSQQGEDLAEYPEREPAEFLDAAEYRRQLLAQALDIIRRDVQPLTWQASAAHGLEGRAAAEVAAELGLSVGAVYAAKFRIMSRLRDDLRGLLEA